MNASKFLIPVLGAGLATGLYFVPHTIGLEKARYYLAIYRKRKEIPIHKNVLKRLKEVMEDLKLTEDEKNKIKPFSSIGYDTLHLGTTYLSYGAILGIGSNLEYIDISKINLEGITVLGDPIDWSRSDAQEFVRSCTFSPEAQKYLFAREVLKIKSRNLLYEILFIDTSVFLVLCYNLMQSRFMPAQKYSLSARMGMRGVSVFLGYFIWGILYDMYDRTINNKNDETIANLGPMYVKGGKEYYEKCLARNFSFRTLLPMGYLYVKKNGESRTVFRWKTPVFSDRIKYFTSKLEAQTKEQVTV